MNEKLLELHDKAKKNFNRAYDNTLDVRNKIVEAQRFVRIPGAQWEGSTFAGYELDKLEKYPRFEINKVARECDRIISEYRNNRIAVRFRPSGDGSDEELAAKLNGKFRADWEESCGNESGDNAFDDAVAGGMGCMRIETVLEDELDPMNESMKIMFRPVYDPATCVYFDPDSKDYDRSDSRWAIELFSMDPESFKEEYPDCELASMDHDSDGKQFDWCTPDAIYIGRYYDVRIEPATLQAWRNPITGEMAVYDDEQIKEVEDELIDGGFEKAGNERKIKMRRVYCGIMSGSEWLEEPARIPGQHIPLVPVYGKRWFIDNQERIEGHVHKAMDMQRLENLMVSMMADNATQAGGENIPIVDINMIPGALANEWAQRNTKRPAFLPMASQKDKSGNIVTQASVAGYTPSTPLSPGLAGMLQYTSGAIQQVTGSNAMENMPSNLASDTVDSIFNRMDTHSYIYMDNMAKSMRQLGRVWLSIAREVFGSDKEMRVVMEDGTDDTVLMSSEVVDRQTGRVISLNDLSIGKYEVAVDVGHSFATRRDATVRTLTTLLQGMAPNDPMRPIVFGMIIDNMDGEGLDDFKDYNRQQLLMSGAVKPKTDEEKAAASQAMQAKQSQPDPMMVAAQAEMQKAQADLVNAQTKSADTQIRAFAAQQDAQLKQAQTVKVLAEAKDIEEDAVRQALKLISDYNNQQANKINQRSTEFANN